jgi:hypothetical protein
MIKIQKENEMIKNIVKEICCILVISSMVMSQQGKYVRKSVSSLESVWFKPGSVGGLQFDSKTFDKFIDFYVEVDRFDYNVLPSNLLQDFRREANSMDEVTPEALSEVLENTVTSKIVEILNDPDVMQQRGEALKDESAFQSFAATKAKSLGLTVDELKMLMNSAYIYLPFISSATKESEEPDELSVTLEGGIIWWQMEMDDEGNTSVEQVLSATTKGIGSADPTEKKILTEASAWPKDFRFGNEKWKTTPVQYAQNSAMLAFCKNLGVKTKKIDDFKLTAQIAEASGSKYGFPLGHREGVHLDDGFHIVEYEEDSEGNEVAVRKGFVRVSKTGDNVEDPNEYTYAKQLYGSKVSEGTVVMEHPVLGMDARLNLGMGFGANIEAKHTTVPLSMFAGAPNVRVLTEDATSMIGGNLVFSYNLAPIINVTQTFLDLDIGFGLPLAAINLDSTSGASFILSPYFGVTKKFSAGRTYTSVGLGGGVDMLSMAGTAEFEYGYYNPITYSYDYTFAVMAPGVKLFGEFGYLINQDLSLVVSGGYKIGLAPVKQMLTLNEVEYELNPAFTALYMPEVDYETLKMGGLSVNIGASYALSELPIDVFGFLDPFKKH